MEFLPDGETMSRPAAPEHTKPSHLWCSHERSSSKWQRRISIFRGIMFLVAFDGRDIRQARRYNSTSSLRSSSSLRSLRTRDQRRAMGRFHLDQISHRTAIFAPGGAYCMEGAAREWGCGYFCPRTAAPETAQPAIDVKSLHAKIGELTLEAGLLSSIWRSCSTGSAAGLWHGGRRSRWRRASALRHSKTPWLITVSPGSSIPIRARSSPARPSPASSRSKVSRSAWMAKALGGTMSLSSGYGAPSNTRRYICGPMTASAMHALRSAATTPPIEAESCSDNRDHLTRGR